MNCANTNLPECMMVNQGVKPQFPKKRTQLKSVTPLNGRFSTNDQWLSKLN